tara:strand:+ start:184 stop:582 length:399 start_codon:yes stop_codon:yes gene_type:complete
MAHYALLNDSNVVTQVVTGVDDDQESALSTEFDCTVKRTSYNTFRNLHTSGGTPFRAFYAGPGTTYDATNDVFIPVGYEWNSTHSKVCEPQPFSTWTMNTSTWMWEPPVAVPADAMTKAYVYNNDTSSWDEA